MFHCLYYPLTINETNEMFKTTFCCFLPIENFVIPFHSSNFPIKLICCGIAAFIYLDKSTPMSL